MGAGRRRSGGQAGLSGVFLFTGLRQVMPEDSNPHGPQVAGILVVNSNLIQQQKKAANQFQMFQLFKKAGRVALASGAQLVGASSCN